MKILRHNLIIVVWLVTATLFSQNRVRNFTESFTVKSDVIVDINTSNTEVTVEHWPKNEVLVEAVMELEGVTIEESKVLFDSWEIEALGNTSKVVISSHPKFSNGKIKIVHGIDFNFDFDIDFEPVIAYAFQFDSVSYPTPPEMPKVFIEKLQKIEWDQKAYEKDKDAYLKQREKDQEKWAKEIEEKFEPMMEEYENKMEKWGKEFAEKYEPKMKEYENKMEKWEKEMETKLKIQQERLAQREKVNEVEARSVEKQFEKDREELAEVVKKRAEKKFELQQGDRKKVKTTILIKIPKNGRVDVDIHKGKIHLPNNVKTL